MTHLEHHSKRGQWVAVDLGKGEQQYRVEDWWDHQSVYGGSWMDATGNPAALKYAARSGVSGIPCDDEVVYGHWANGIGDLVHVSEIKSEGTGEQE